MTEIPAGCLFLLEICEETFMQRINILVLVGFDQKLSRNTNDAKNSSMDFTRLHTAYLPIIRFIA